MIPFAVHLSENVMLAICGISVASLLLAVYVLAFWVIDEIERWIDRPKVVRGTPPFASSSQWLVMRGQVVVKVCDSEAEAVTLAMDLRRL